MQIRVSTGSAIALGLMKGSMISEPCITYLMLTGVCDAKCSYCTWGMDDYLSRGRWPEFDVSRLKNVNAFCLQTIEKKGLEAELDEVLERINAKRKDVAISYMTAEREEILERNSVKSIGIGLDACTEALYRKHKPRLSWNRAIESMKCENFEVACHVILGLGESDEDFLRFVQDASAMGVKLALFAYTPVRGKRPVGSISINRYRTLQLASHLIESGKITIDDLSFEGGKLVSMPEMMDERAFLTRGCGSCNRPFYNERASHEPMNFSSEACGYDFEREIREYMCDKC
jgi:biotin synthase